MEYRKRVCQAMNFITQNLDRDPSLEEIAKAASFSMFHFHRIFKAVVGETVAAFTRRLRLESAANRLLANPHCDITSIALDCGFSSSQNFAKAFRQHFGTTPTKFRKSKIGNKDSKNENEFSIKPMYDSDKLFMYDPNKEKKIDLDATVKKMPDFRVAYIRKLGNYDKKTHHEAFAELMKWAIPRSYKDSGSIFGLYWDNPDVTPQGKCRVDACISVPKGTIPDEPIGIQTIHGGKYAVCQVEVQGDNFQQPWEKIFKWIISKGYECDDKPNYQIYRNYSGDPAQDNWFVDICVPLSEIN